MIYFTISFILCSALLMLVYRIFLINEKMLKFNRAYLILSLVFSLVIPFIHVKMQRENVPVVYQKALRQIRNTDNAIAYVRNDTRYMLADKVIYTDLQIDQPDVSFNRFLPITLLSIYGVVTLLLLSKYLINLYRISNIAYKGEVLPFGDNELILTDNLINPHSFLKYIFINKSQYNNGLIEPQIIQHEEAHATQLHTWDILFIELVQVFCWFNPAVISYRQAIQLNHEFLADDAVIALNNDTPTYQLLLLTKAGQNNNLQLTSQFNYQTTKKRLLMMTKTKSTKTALLKQICLIPVIAVAVLLFSQKAWAHVYINNAKSITSIKNFVKYVEAKTQVKNFNAMGIGGYGYVRAKHKAPQAIIDSFNNIIKKYNVQQTPGKVFPKVVFTPQLSESDKIQLEALYRQMSGIQQFEQQIYFINRPDPLPKKSPTEQQLSQWQDDQIYGVWIDEKRIANSVLANYKTWNFDGVAVSNLTKRAIKNDHFNCQIDLMTKPYYAAYVAKRRAQPNYMMFYRVSMAGHPKAHGGILIGEKPQ